MKNISTFFVVSFISMSLFASNKYFTHHKIESKDSPLGEWSIDYVQLKALPGKTLTPQQIQVNNLLKSSAEGAVPDTQDSSSGQSSVYIKTDVTFVSSRLLALDISYDTYYAGAAHPNAGVSSSIYDLSLGQEIALSTGLPVGPYGEKIESPEFKSLAIKKLIAKASADPGLEGECMEFYDEASLEFLNVSLSPRSVTVSPSFPHVAKACEISVAIPMRELKSVAKPGSLLEELIKGAN